MASILILVKIILKSTECFPQFLSGYSHRGQPWKRQVESTGLSRCWRHSSCSAPLRPTLLGKLHHSRGWTLQVTEGHCRPSWVSPQLSTSVLLPGDWQLPPPSFILRFATHCGCQWSPSSSSYSQCCHAQSFLLGILGFSNFSRKCSPCWENNRTKPGLF